MFFNIIHTHTQRYINLTNERQTKINVKILSKKRMEIKNTTMKVATERKENTQMQ